MKAHGGKNGAEPRARVRTREMVVLQRTLDGHTQHEIAEELDISQPAVSKILRRVEERLATDSSCRLERQHIRLTLRRDHLYKEALAGWRRSQDDAQQRRHTKSSGTTGATGTLAELVSAKRDGDPRFIEAARKVLADQCALSGVNAPPQHAVSAPRSPYADLPDEQLVAILEEKRRLLGECGEGH